MLMDKSSVGGRVMRRQGYTGITSTIHGHSNRCCRTQRYQAGDNEVIGQLYRTQPDTARTGRSILLDLHLPNAACGVPNLLTVRTVGEKARVGKEGIPGAVVNTTGLRIEQVGLGSVQRAILVIREGRTEQQEMQGEYPAVRRAFSGGEMPDYPRTAEQVGAILMTDAVGMIEDFLRYEEDLWLDASA